MTQLKQIEVRLHWSGNARDDSPDETMTWNIPPEGLDAPVCAGPDGKLESIREHIQGFIRAHETGEDCPCQVDT